VNVQHTDIVSTVGFRDDEPVISTHPVLCGACIPAFGDTVVWDFNGVLRRPANLAAAHWKLCFSKELTDPFWNLLARELCMIELSPRHPVLIAAGLSRAPSPAALTTLTQVLTSSYLGAERPSRRGRAASLRPARRCSHGWLSVSCWSAPGIGALLFLRRRT
jgi:hypothetical protein